MYTGGIVRAKNPDKNFALSGLFGAKCSLPKKMFRKNNQIVRI